MGLYYRIWVDCITRLRSREVNKDNWQLKSMLTMSSAMTFNLVLVMVIIQREVLGYFFYELNVNSFSGYENYIFTMLILYALPCVIINYLLIFRNKRYEMLLKKYPYNNERLFVAYFSISLVLPIVLIWIGIFLFH
jgi:hypothetical protein